MEGFSHVPVLLAESLNALRIRPDGVYVDGTLGRAGHAQEIAKRLTTGRLIGIDRDGEAIAAADARLAPWQERLTLLRGNFSDLAALLDQAGVELCDGMLFDLGVSSPQLDDAKRGFSYLHDAPLDMRMDTDAPLTAREIVNGWTEAELRRILWEYGEERYAPAIARAIVRERENHTIESTGDLVRIVKGAMPAKALREKQHPAKRTFQAVRIAVNGELDALEPMIRAAAERLAPGGRIAIITFHSLEDRLVKRTIRDLAQGCTCPKEFPVCVCGRRRILIPVNRKPVTAEETEVEANPRSRSAKLRVAERCGADGEPAFRAAPRIEFPAEDGRARKSQQDTTGGADRERL